MPDPDIIRPIEPNDDDDPSTGIGGMTALDFIAALRGGYPEKCDFCDQPYTNERYPVPEEAGEWACSECYARWYPPKAKEPTT